MKVLIISGTFIPMSPGGPAYIAGAVRKAGHKVEVFDGFLAGDLTGELKEKLAAFDPDIAGLSITTVTGDVPDRKAEFGTKYVDLRPRIKSLVDVIKQHSDARIVPGGCGFNYFAREWLDYLDLDYGLRGEGEYSFPLYLERLKRGEEAAELPGCIVRKNGQFHKVARDHVRDFDNTAFPAYDLFDLDTYRELKMPYALFTKRGCAFRCAFCPHRSLEGSRYRLKSPKRVVDEIEHVIKTTGATSFNFCDNSFNCPKSHAEAICREIIARGLEIKWQTGAMKPLGLTRDFCQLLKDSGCENIGLSTESVSQAMLANMERGYRVEDVMEALDNLSDSDIPFGVFTLLGAPGETPETIAETFEVIDRYPKIAQIWVSIGICLWTQHQKVLEIARRDGQLKDDRALFDGAYYISPDLPQDFMVDFIESLKSKKNYWIQVNKPYAAYQKQVNTIR
jgi:radical SAM superfamily enzyme YgiQ (UPF0313 family)